MSRLAARRLRGEEGASLIITMAFIVLFSVLLTALLSFATTSFSSQASIQKNTKDQAAAAAAIDTAITKVRNDPTMLVGGDPANGGTCGANLLTYRPTGADHDATVDCVPVGGTDAVQPGVGGPANALLTLGTGISATGPGSVKTTGNVFSTGSITLNQGATLDATEYAITAGSCSPPLTGGPLDSTSPWLAVRTDCPAPLTAEQVKNTPNDGADPHYPNRLADVPNTFNPVPTCLGRTLKFAPGHYTDMTYFTPTNWTVTPSPPGFTQVSCSGGTLTTAIYFAPGAYYFDFGLGNPDTSKAKWTVSSLKVVGGSPGGTSPYNGSSDPTAINADGTSGSGKPVNCNGSPGVQFILGGASQIALGVGGQMELCPTVDAKGFGIAIVGLNSSSPGIGGTTTASARVVPTNAVAPAGNATQIAACTPGTSSTTNVPMSGVTAPATFPGAVVATTPVGPASTPINGQTAFAGGPKTPPVAPNPPPIPVGGSGSVVLCGWQATDAPVPPGSTITAIQLQIAHYELPCPLPNSQQDPNGNDDGTCKPGPTFSDPGEVQDNPPGQPDCDGDDPCINGTIKATVSVGDAGGPSCDTPNMASRLVLGTEMTSCSIGALLGATSDASFMQSLRVRFHVDVTGLPAAQAFLDGIVMTISYNTPVTQPGSGCVVTFACPALSAPTLTPQQRSNGPVLAEWGTAYLPSASLALDFSGFAKIAFDRGLIASSVTLTGLPSVASQTASKGQFRLGSGSGRTFDLTATSGNAKITARIRIVDSATASPHGFAVAVREWSTAS